MSASPLADRAQRASAFNVGLLAQAVSPCAPRISEKVTATLTNVPHDNFEDENTSEGLKANPDGPDAEPVGPSPLRAQDESDGSADTLAGSGPTSQPSGMVEASTWSPILEAVWSSEDPGTTPPKSRVMAQCAVHSPQAASWADGDPDHESVKYSLSESVKYSLSECSGSQLKGAPRFCSNSC